jgi:alpha-beta hydrolase superfamily lysophospholipase
MRVVVRGVVVVAAVLVLLLAVAWVFQRHLIYFPSTDPVPPAGDVLPGASDVVLTTSDGLRLGAWFVPAGAPDRGVTVLVAAGNAGDRSMRAPLAAALAAEGLAVLLFDYRGYGGNPGDPTEEGLARDVDAAHRYLVEERGVPPERLLYFGESLGAAVVTGLATRRPPAGMVLRSPFEDLAATGRAHYPFLPVRTLLRDRYPVAEQVRTVTAPVVVVYGSADSVVPPEQSRTVAASAPTLHALVEVPGADHNDRSLLDGRSLVAAVVSLASGGA